MSYTILQKKKKKSSDSLKQLTKSPGALSESQKLTIRTYGFSNTRVFKKERKRSIYFALSIGGSTGIVHLIHHVKMNCMDKGEYVLQHCAAKLGILCLYYDNFTAYNIFISLY